MKIAEDAPQITLWIMKASLPWFFLVSEDAADELIRISVPSTKNNEIFTSQSKFYVNLQTDARVFLPLHRT